MENRFLNYAMHPDGCFWWAILTALFSLQRLYSVVKEAE